MRPAKIVAMLLILSALGRPAYPQTRLSVWQEDVNGDGRMNICDVLSLVLFALANPSDPRADYNGDGHYNVADIRALISSLREDSLHPSTVVQSSWSVVGPGGGGGVFLPTISPFDPGLMLAHCDMTGAYLTRDGGRSWRMINLWNVPTDFEFDPVDPDVIYAAVKGSLYGEDRGSGLSLLFRSVDRGESWRIVYPLVQNAQATDEIQSRDILPSQLIPGTPDGSIDKVAVDPADNSRIFLGLSPLAAYIGDGTGGPAKSPMLVVSTDRGLSWRVAAELSGNNVLGIFPRVPGKTPDEITVFTDKSCTRVNLATGKTTQIVMPVSTITEVAGGESADGFALYILSSISINRSSINGGVYRTTNPDSGWSQVNNGLFTGIPSGKAPQLRALAVCGHHADVLYIASSNPGYSSGSSGTAWSYGIFKSENGGNSWTGVWLANDHGYVTSNYQGSWLDRSYDPGWGGQPINLGVAPSNPDVCFGGDNGRAYGTLDGGKTWTQVYSHNNADNSVTSNGMDVTTCYGVHFDPFDTGHMFITYTDIGLFQSYDGGRSWLHAVSGIPGEWLNTCYWMTFDPAVEGRIWSAWSNAHDLPRDKMFSSDALDWFAGGVAASDDGGKTWRTGSNGLPSNAACTDILVDPTSPSGSRTLYVTVFNRGVYRSTDGGANWSSFNDGLGANLYAWQIRRNSQGRLYLLLCRGRRTAGTVAGQVFSRDPQASSWEPVKLPQGVNAPHDLEIDPRDDRVLYLSCWVNHLEGRDAYGGLYRSDDGGQSWKQTFDERIRVNSAALDPQNPDIVFINTFQNAAWRSDDRGGNWKRLEGYRFKWGQRAIPDVNNPGMLYLTTFGGSVYHGPADGDPGAPKDILNMPAGWW